MVIRSRPSLMEAEEENEIDEYRPYTISDYILLPTRSVKITAGVGTFSSLIHSRVFNESSCRNHQGDFNPLPQLYTLSQACTSRPAATSLAGLNVVKETRDASESCRTFH